MDELARIKSLIYEIRGVKVMLDKDLADLYHVTTGNLNKAVKRNIRRFPSDFMFQLTKKEWDSLRFQFGIIESGRGKYTKYLPHAFTEQGLAMLSGVLNSEIAIDVNISIMRAFVALRNLPSLVRREDLLEAKREVIDYIDEILSDQNDINESTRAQLDAISTALAELQASKSPNANLNYRRPIGFIQPEDEEES
ncbi:MAG: ORF6N domain-containing protein [Prevotella sp.]|nr:ORF6N domain-containing protein [Prevotella sp.]